MPIPFTKSLTKTACQKAVRNSDVDKAIRCIKSSLEVDPKNLSRRIPVIVIEDGFLHPNLDKLIDFIRRSQRKAYTLTKADGELVINTIADVASLPFRDEFVAGHPLTQKAEKLVSEGNFEPLKEPEQALVNALKYRARIGGLSFDIELFNRMADIWTYRFSKGGWSVKKLEKIYKKHNFKYDEVPHAKKSDILLQSVDFHVSSLLGHLTSKPNIVIEVKKHYPTLNPEYVLQEMVWRMRAGINTKPQITSKKPLDWFETHTGYGGDYFLGEEHRKKMTAIYEVAKPECDSYAKWFIENQKHKHPCAEFPNGLFT